MITDINFVWVYTYTFIFSNLFQNTQKPLKVNIYKKNRIRFSDDYFDLFYGIFCSTIFILISTCLITDIYIEVNNHTMKPLEEYMLFTKSGAENITVLNSLGVRSAQCNSQFDIIEHPPPGHSLNMSMVI